jgi:hypothetical protein
LPAKEQIKQIEQNLSIIDVAHDLVPKPIKPSPISQPGEIKDISGALDTPFKRPVSRFQLGMSTNRFGGVARDVKANSFNRGSENQWHDDPGISVNLEANQE